MITALSLARTYRLALVLAIHFFVFAATVHASVRGSRDPADYIYDLMIASLIVMACAQDARIRGTPILMVVQFIMFVTWPISGPIYLIWSRGWWGILWAIGLVLTVSACSIAGRFLVYQLSAS